MPASQLQQKQENNILNFRLLYDHILVRPFDAESVNGLVKPEQYDDKPEFGEVIRCGEGRLMEDGKVVPLKMKPGDVIFFGKYSSQMVRSGGQDYLLVREDDVIAVHDQTGTTV